MNLKLIRFVCLFLLLVVITGCATESIIKSDLQNPSKSLRVTVTSVPSGAKVYGVSGTYLGTTPLSFSFVGRDGGVGIKFSGRIINGDNFENWKEISRWIPRSGHQIIAKNEILELEALRNFMHTNLSIYIKCLVVLDGYESYELKELLGSDNLFDLGITPIGGYNHAPHVYKKFHGQHKEFTAVLLPKQSAN